jgi:hypothetical protein
VAHRFNARGRSGALRPRPESEERNPKNAVSFPPLFRPFDDLKPSYHPIMTRLFVTLTFLSLFRFSRFVPIHKNLGNEPVAEPHGVEQRGPWERETNNPTTCRAGMSRRKHRRRRKLLSEGGSTYPSIHQTDASSAPPVYTPSFVKFPNKNAVFSPKNGLVYLFTYLYTENVRQALPPRP